MVVEVLFIPFFLCLSFTFSPHSQKGILILIFLLATKKKKKVFLIWVWLLSNYALILLLSVINYNPSSQPQFQMKVYHNK